MSSKQRCQNCGAQAIKCLGCECCYCKQCSIEYCAKWFGEDHKCKWNDDSKPSYRLKRRWDYSEPHPDDYVRT